MDENFDVYEELEGSTDVKGIYYHSGSHDLDVFFMRGVVYRYKEVPPGIVAGLRGANSKGRYVGKYLKGKYRAVRVDVPEEEG